MVTAAQDGEAKENTISGSCFTVVGCWAHVRRKFDEALKILPENARIGTGALHGKSFCDRMFALEWDFVNMPPEERLVSRMKQLRLVMDEFFEWAEKTGAKTLPNTPLGRAVKYAMDQKNFGHLLHICMEKT